MHYLLVTILFSIMIGIILRHYFDDKIPFDRVFNRLEIFINNAVNRLYKFIKGKYVRSVWKVLCKLGNAIKCLILKLVENRTAIWNAVKKFLIYIKETATGEDIQKQLVDNTLLLRHEDTIALIKKLTGHPYDTPTFENYSYGNGIAWYDYQALQLSGKYEDLDGDSLRMMLESIIQNHIWETRAMKAAVFIRIATPTRLYFGIALSKQGEIELEKQRQAAVPARQEKKPSVLEENVIDLFDGQEDSE